MTRQAPPLWSRYGAALALVLVLGVAAWEAALALRAPSRVAAQEDWEAAARIVRQGFTPGDLIVFAPPWADPLGRQVLGDLMPASMVGRPDAARYGRIWEVSLRGARAPETGALRAVSQHEAGGVRVARYEQRAVTVTLDLVEDLPRAQVSQAMVTAPPYEGETPCIGQRCPGSMIERRMMEIDYQPRYGVLVPVEAGRRTVLTYEVPAAALAGARLVVWAGLHDYYARKTESGPVDLVLDLDQGARRVPVSVQPRGWQRWEIEPPGGQDRAHTLRLEISAKDARARFLGMVAEVRR